MRSSRVVRHKQPRPVYHHRDIYPPPGRYASLGGLHLLHLHPFRRWDARCGSCPRGPQLLDGWLRIEADVAAGLDGVAATFPATRRGYFATHSVCETRYARGYAVAVHRYARAASVPDECVALVRELAPARAASNESARELCASAALTRAGAKHVRARELAALSAARFADVDVVDGFALTDHQCWATGPEDGRHYPALVPLQVSAFLSYALGGGSFDSFKNFDES